MRRVDPPRALLLAARNASRGVRNVWTNPDLRVFTPRTEVKQKRTALHTSTGWADVLAACAHHWDDLVACADAQIPPQRRRRRPFTQRDMLAYVASVNRRARPCGGHAEHDVRRWRGYAGQCRPASR